MSSSHAQSLESNLIHQRPLLKRQATQQSPLQRNRKSGPKKIISSPIHISHISRSSKSKHAAEHAILRVSLRPSTSFRESRTSPEVSPGKYRTQTAEARQSRHLQHVTKHVTGPPRTPIQSSNHYTHLIKSSPCYNLYAHTDGHEMTHYK